MGKESRSRVASTEVDVATEMDMPTSVGAVHQLVMEAYERLEASSIMLYVPDPVWTDQFRAVEMIGVKIREPMHGFTMGARKVLTNRSGQCFFNNARKTSLLRDSSDGALDTIPDSVRHLFGDFVTREGVRSCARVHILDPDRNIAGVLFVNFSERNAFATKGDGLARRGIVEELAKGLEELLPGLGEELRGRPDQPMAELLHILEPIRNLAQFGLEDPEALAEFFNSILVAAVQAFDLPKDTGFGSIHLLNPEATTLSLCAHTHPGLDVPHEQDIRRGEGVVSWVALRGGAIVIPNLEVSCFRPIHIRSLEGIQSELAVPMIAGGKILGVVNLESTQKNAFSTHSVRPMAYAANQAAMAVRMSQLTASYDSLLRTCHDVASGRASSRGGLDALTEATATALRADRCEVWLCDEGNSGFLFGGSCPRTEDEPECPRRRGWSQEIVRNAVPVWLSYRSGRKEFRAFAWREEKWQAYGKGPKTMRGRFPGAAEGGDLGLPLLVRDRVVGVFWVKYRSEQNPPSLGQMRLALGFTSQCAMIVDLIAQERREQEQKHEGNIRHGFQREHFPTGKIDFGGVPWLDAYAVTQPCGSTLGGDFHFATRIDEGTAGLILGDAEHHGSIGLLHMLPLYSIARAFLADSSSTVPVMERVRKTATDLDVRGTAMCVAFHGMTDHGSVWLTVSNAGHPSLYVFRRGGDVEVWPKFDGPSNSGWLGRLPQDVGTPPLISEHLEAKPGDVILAYTDGVSDVLREHGLRSAVNVERTPKAIAHAVLERARRRSPGGVLADDVTVVAIKIRDPRAKKA